MLFECIGRQKQIAIASNLLWLIRDWGGSDDGTANPSLTYVLKLLFVESSETHYEKNPGWIDGTAGFEIKFFQLSEILRNSK